MQLAAPSFSLYFFSVDLVGFYGIMKALEAPGLLELAPGDDGKHSVYISASQPVFNCFGISF